MKLGLSRLQHAFQIRVAEPALLPKLTMALESFNSVQLLSLRNGFETLKGLVVTNAAINVHESVISLSALSFKCLALRLTKRSSLQASL